ncbi:MAG: FAD-dependent oxidoreductase [Verrucomicrobiota bacterium]
MRLLSSFRFTAGLSLFLVLIAASAARGGEILVEAESFETHGGWKLDTQFIELMGSPYLLAHGLGEPVEDAVTTIKVNEAGTYHVWVRTKDWAATFDREGSPGRFQLAIGGETLETEFGTESPEWTWQNGGTVGLDDGLVGLALKDLTGFCGRCDAILLTTDADFTPDNGNAPLPEWRRTMLGLEAEPEDAGDFDLVVIGGGYSGMGAAVSAARMGIKVALIQNRDVLGGNGSSEIRVWAKGNTPDGLYPVGDIIRELEDTASASPAPFAEWEDDKKERILRNEKNLSLFLGHHAFTVQMNSKEEIGAVLALETRTNRIRKFEAPFFVDATGHGFIGMWAGADIEMHEKGRMGMSNMWMWENTTEAQAFPETPWAHDLTEEEYPYPRRFHAEWFWESGYDLDPLNDLEKIRDWNLLASFGAWNGIKNKGQFADYDPLGISHANARLKWLAYVGGTRETQQILGDVILSESDIVSKKEFEDGCVLTTWSFVLLYPKEESLGIYKDNPFISVAHHNRAIDKRIGYPVPYRCFYSRNISNLFTAGRNVSVTHEALGTVRVMKTCGMMGVVVGKAASICLEKDCHPRDVYQEHWDDMVTLLEMPGNMRRATLTDTFLEDTSLTPMAPIAYTYIRPQSLPGIVVDDANAVKEGNWKTGAGLKDFIGESYSYASATKPATARFNFTPPKTGEYDVRIAWQPHENRSPNALVIVEGAKSGTPEQRVNQQEMPPLEKGFSSLGTYSFEGAVPASITLSNDGAKGNIHADAIQLLPIEPAE